MSDDIKFSVILPAYNEADCLAKSLDTVKAYLDSTGESFEILLVDDGSTDTTLAIAEKSMTHIPELRVLPDTSNHGKGYVVRKGMLAAKGDYRLFCDTDLAVPVHQLALLISKMDKGYDIAIGSRYLHQDSPKHTVWYRRLMGWGFNLFVRSLTSLEYKDTQCGFKCFSAKSAEAIFSRMTLIDFGFDVEALWLAQQMKLKVIEVPIDWWSKKETKVSLFRDSLRMIEDLWYIRRRGAQLRRQSILVPPVSTTADTKETMRS